MPTKIFTLVRLIKSTFFDEETKKIRQNLQELGQFELKDGSLQARKSLAYSLAHLFEGRDRVSFSQEFQNLAQDLTHPEDFPRQATQVQADLRDYQERESAGCKCSIIMVLVGF